MVFIENNYAPMMTTLPAAADIEYFLEVARTQHISRAAERLGITQPSLSLAIQRLEAHLGGALLVRSRTGVKLTRLGDQLARRAHTLKQQWEDLLREAAKAQQDITGRYVLGAHPSVCMFSWNHILGGLIKDYSGLELKLVHDHSRLTEEVISFRIDFAVVINPLPHPDLVMKKLGDDQVALWVAARGHVNRDVLIYDEEMQQAQAILRRLKMTEFGRSVISPNLEVVADLTAKGAGVGILPSRVARRSVHEGLKLFSSNGPTFQDSVYFIYRKDLQTSLAAQKLAQDLFQRLART